MTENSQTIILFFPLVCASSWLVVRAQLEVLLGDQDNMPTLHLLMLLWIRSASLAQKKPIMS